MCFINILLKRIRKGVRKVANPNDLFIVHDLYLDRGTSLHGLKSIERRSLCLKNEFVADGLQADQITIV